MAFYAVDIHQNDEQRKILLHRRQGESERHIALKLLAYVVYFERQTRVEVAVGQQHKPDLVLEQYNHVRLWIDCGQISINKLDKVVHRNPLAEIVVVKSTPGVAQAYRRQAIKKVRHHERVRYLAFDESFLADFLNALSTRSTLHAVQDLDNKSLQLTVNGMRLQTTIHWL